MAKNKCFLCHSCHPSVIFRNYSCVRVSISDRDRSMEGTGIGSAGLFSASMPQSRILAILFVGKQPPVTCQLSTPRTPRQKGTGTKPSRCIFGKRKVRQTSLQRLFENTTASSFEASAQLCQISTTMQSYVIPRKSDHIYDAVIMMRFIGTDD